MTAYERSSINRFLLIYLGSSFVFIVIMGFLFYDFQSTAKVELTKQQMKLYAQSIGGKIIDDYMQGKSDFLLETNRDFQVALFDKNAKLIKTQYENPLLRDAEFVDVNGSYYLQDGSARDHFGVHTIVIRESGLVNQINQLFYKVVGVCIFAILLFSAIGAYLAKLFLRPIRDEIERFDRFIADSAHELNTPVAALLLIADALKSSSSDERNLSRLKIAARSISNIYDDLAFFAKKGEIQSFDEVLDVADILSQRVELLSDMAKLKNIELTMQLERCEISIDRAKLQKLLDNLLSNAIKYTPNNGSIKIKLAQRTLNIEDSGNGIPQNMSSRVFDRDFRLDRKQHGFGIGLAIVKSICDEYGIEIIISKSLLGGAGFELVLG